MEAITKHPIFPYLATLSAGLITVLSLSPFNQWFLAPVAAGLFFWAIEPQDKTKSILKLAFLFGLTQFGFGASWVYVSIHDYGYTGKPLAVLLTSLFCLGLAVVHGLFFYSYAAIRNKQDLFGPLNILLFAGIATLIEASRSWVFSGFPWLLLGYSQTESVFRGLAPILGVYGLSLIIYLSGGVFAALLSSERKQYQHQLYLLATICLSVWIASALLTNKHWTTPVGESQSVSFIQANISQHEKWRPESLNKTLALYRNKTQQELHDGQLVLWPEAAIPLYKDHADHYLRSIANMAKNTNSAIVLGIPFRGEGKPRPVHNSVAAIGVAEGVYHKRHLVPFGEYVPFQSFFGSLMKVFNLPLSSMQPGEKNQTPLQVLSWQTVPLVCYEIVFPSMTANAAKHSDVLITLSNDTWFGASIGPLQHLQMAQMRALENGRYVLRSTGSGVTAIINASGIIDKQAPQFEEAVLRGEYYLMEGSTPWTRFGHWLVHLLCVLLVCPAIYQKIRQRSA